jgi:hypothetical protein
MLCGHNPARRHIGGLPGRMEALTPAGGRAEKKPAINFKMELIVDRRTIGFLWKINSGEVAY